MKYVPDLRRREPRNVGVILRTSSGEWQTQFLGEGDDGRIDGRKVRSEGLNIDAYRSWTDYFRRKASDARWSDVERLQKRRTGSYFAELAGSTQAEEQDDPQLLGRLFSELVRAPEAIHSNVAMAASPILRLRERVNEVFELANVNPVRDPYVEAIFEGQRTKVPFGYEYTNGQRHLMDILQKHIRPAEAAADARDLRSRVQGAMAADTSRSFFVFYSDELLDGNHADEILYPIEKLSETVNVDDRKDAVGKLRAKLLH